MRSVGLIAVLLVLAIGVWTFTGGVAASSRSQDARVAMVDDCEPTDPGWTPTGGCLLKPKEGDVSIAEFGALLFSPLGPGGVLIGHPSWRNEPSYISTFFGRKITVDNLGGRVHTFTEVTDFGGGRVMQLNGALAPAPACLNAAVNVAPGDSLDIQNLPIGLHKFQCCIHPWMRAAIRVSEK